VSSFKTLHGLQPFAKHHRSISIADVLEASKEELMVNGKQKKTIKTIKKKWITHK
jgi:hypothetical protein